MKRIISTFLVGILLLLSSCGTKEDADINMTEFRETIVAAEEISENLFTNDFESEIIGYLVQENGLEIEIIKYEGPNNRFGDVCTALSDYCTVEVADILIREQGYMNVAGDIGLILADGEVRYTEFQEENMHLLSADEETVVIQITRFDFYGDYSKDYVYTFEKREDGKFVIIDIQRVLEKGEFDSKEKVVPIEEYEE